MTANPYTAARLILAQTFAMALGAVERASRRDQRPAAPAHGAGGPSGAPAKVCHLRGQPVHLQRAGFAGVKGYCDGFSLVTRLQRFMLNSIYIYIYIYIVI